MRPLELPDGELLWLPDEVPVPACDDTFNAESFDLARVWLRERLPERADEPVTVELGGEAG